MSRSNLIQYIEFEDYVEGIMPDGSIFKIDTDDYEAIKSHFWHLLDGYIRCTKLGLMHRYVMREHLKKGYEVDHINRDRLDNRKSNLRVATRQENMKNKSIYSNNTSGYPGVKWNSKLGKWQVQITVDRNRRHLGVFARFQDALVARRTAERDFFR